MNHISDLQALHAQHVLTCQQRAEHALNLSGFDALLIASGVEKYAFLDDRPYLFQPNPHFKAWLPLTQHPNSWLLVRPGRKPVLVYFQPDDYWHVPPAAPSGYWVDQVELHVINQAGQAEQVLLSLLGTDLARVAIVGEADAALGRLQPNNPPALLHSLHFARGCKTPYELHCMREASCVAAKAHLAARDAFMAGASEAEIHRAYLVASGHTDRDLPYANIVALNEHCAVLHYQYQELAAPAQSRSFLLDAGAQVQGYASDVTRTWSRGGDAGSAAFEALLAGMEAAQLRLVGQVRAGVDYRDIHLSTHAEVAGLLRACGVVDMSEEAMQATGVTAVFFPHGVGHLLGLQVHDVGGFIADEAGTPAPKPEGHPYLRLTRVLEPGMVVTIEPGLYFIPTLLDKLKAGPHAGAVDWPLVAQLSRFGGIRIEDDVCCLAQGGPENLTRDAFAQLQ
ncbi:MAG: Xaa-Pro dipeptidase [Burkholderiaceae bacterium]|nr:Xaa-Pro dipeptidase [Roseateles sp.]MBV8471307.1 Xaa-Pro dipeptidase [Burkholderiaceae bacterium]